MIRGAFVTLLLALNTTFWGSLIALLGIVKFAIQLTAPRSRARTRVILMLAALATRWVAVNDAIYDAMLPTRWTIRGIDAADVTPAGHYLIISNHASWVDILALFRAFHRRAPFIRFFLKQQLFWMPVVGQGCWALEFPFMRRYSPEYLAAHPEKRGTDLATTRRACQRYRNFPVAVLNFLEGTRFTPSKREEQESPYRHLLRPRIGGLSFVLASLGDQLDAMFDVTLAYPPDGNASLWRFVTGRMPEIVVDIRRIDPPARFFDEAVTQPGAARDALKAWVEELWRDKDERIDAALTVV
jgi:1-acyl-sn-glycerol-3-phosphate acyltransferase